MEIVVLDCETDGLQYDCTKIHVMSWTKDGVKYQSTKNYDRMIDVIKNNNLIVCHNGIRFDQVVFNRILGLPMDYKKWIDTLALSWALFPNRHRHGLADIGVEHGVKKPKIDDWQNLSYQEYAHRCEEDCRINWLEWKKQERRLKEIYE